MQPCQGQGGQTGWGLRMNQPGDRLQPSDAGRKEDRGNDEEASPTLGARGAQQEGDSEWDCSACISEVENQVGQQRDTAAGDEDDCLSAGREPQHRKRESDCHQPLPRAFDALVDEAVGMPLAVMAMVALVLKRLVQGNGLLYDRHHG